MKNVNVPNGLTVARIICLVPMVIIGLHNPFQGALIAAVLGISDFLDGYIARRFNQSTALGRILDPISDRLLLITSFIIFAVTEVVPLWYLLIIGLREVLVSVGTLIIFVKKLPRPDVNQLGKISALGSMIATPSWVVVYTHYGLNEKFFLVLALAGTIVSIPTGYMSLGDYMKAFKPKNNR